MVNAERKFVDLVHAACNKYANFDPPRKIKIGDYGEIDPETGRFEKAGNIFKNKEFEDLVKDYPPSEEDAVVEDQMTITSTNARSIGVDASFSADATVAKASFKNSWNFSGEAGAIIVSHKPRRIALNEDMDINALCKHPLLVNQVLVREIIRCPTYALFFNQKGNDNFSLALTVEAPIPQAPGVKVGPEFAPKWTRSSAAGVFREGGFKVEAEDHYTVLFGLKKCKEKGFKMWFRNTPPPEDKGLDKLEDASPPWQALDSDGEEDAIVDSVAAGGADDDEDEEL